MEKLNLKAIKELAVLARGKWLAAHSSEELISKKVSELLNDAFLQIILKFIKIDQIWGNDYYMSGSARFFRENVTKAVDKWVNERAGQPFEITGETKEEITKLYNRTVIEKIKSKIEDVANSKAVEVIESIIDTYSKDLPEEIIL